MAFLWRISVAQESAWSIPIPSAQDRIDDRLPYFVCRSSQSGLWPMASAMKLLSALAPGFS
jgi:hypothetical protein